MSTGERMGWLCLVVLVIGFLFCFGIIAIIQEQETGDSRFYTSDQCLKCGYPEFQVSDGTGYCIRLESGTEVVVPVSEACSKGE